MNTFTLPDIAALKFVRTAPIALPVRVDGQPLDYRAYPGGVLDDAGARGIRRSRPYQFLREQGVNLEVVHAESLQHARDAAALSRWNRPA